MGLLFRTLRPLIFLRDPEAAHELVLHLAKLAARVSPLLKSADLIFGYQSERLRTTVAGIDFPNPVGMAAGFDKSGELYPFLSHAGFGFVESGTFTAKRQEGNPKKRVFRLPDHGAIINRMGFNNPGAADAAHTISSQVRLIPRGINIGKSKVTPIERAVEDYLESLSLLHPYADYIALNVSSPNTPGLRSLQARKSLTSLLTSIQKEINGIAKREKRRIPLFVKLAPDLTEREFKETLDTAMKCGIAGVILTNTTIDHSSVPELSRTEGGLSGRPLRDRSTEMIRRARTICGKSLSIIGVGGIFSGADALEKIRAGADLIQIYTGYIYEGPGLPAAICRELDAYLEREGATLSEIVGR